MGNELMVKVVVAEDEDLILNHIIKKIQQVDPTFMVVGAAQNGKQALEMVEECSPDIIVTDIRMPGMTGIELMERLDNERAQLPVVVLSSVLDEATRAKALALGVSAWLAKPVTDAHLLGAIATAMESAGPDAER